MIDDQHCRRVPLAGDSEGVNSKERLFMADLEVRDTFFVM